MRLTGVSRTIVCGFLGAVGNIGQATSSIKGSSDFKPEVATSNLWAGENRVSNNLETLRISENSRDLKGCCMYHGTSMKEFINMAHGLKGELM